MESNKEVGGIEAVDAEDAVAELDLDTLGTLHI